MWNRCRNLPFVTLVLAACQPEQGRIPGGDFDPTVRTRDPGTLISLLASTSTPEASRRSADGLLVEAQGKTDPARLGVLEQILYAPGHSDAMRIYALDQLAAADAGRAGRALMLHLPRLAGEGDAGGGVLAHACAVAVELGDERVIDALVRSLERGLGTEGAGGQGGRGGGAGLQARPEWGALEKLGGGRPVVEILYGRLADATDRSARTAALAILTAVLGAEPVKARVKGLGARDAWLADLQWWVSTFDALPRGETEMGWVQYLHRPERAALVERALERHRQLRGTAGGGEDGGDYEAAPRFVHTLAYVDEETMRLGREALVASLRARLAAMRHLDRPPAGPAEEPPTTIEAQQSMLSRGDLLAIHMLLKALELPANLQEFHRLGMADLSDTRSEHGGLLALINLQRPTLMITPYAPLYADNDLEYVASDRLLQETVNGVAQFHFHYQQVRNGERAGPGPGDLAYARRTRCNCVTVTSTGPREFNVDFYTPAGAVVDLGTYGVPASSPVP
jgi:hypothetical protein